MLLKEFDGGKAVIEPYQTMEVNPELPKVYIGVFSQLVVEECVKKYGGVEADTMVSILGDKPLYKVEVDGFEFCLFVPYLGGPGAGGQLEQIIAKGGTHFVFAGCCGVLRHDIADGHLIVPTAALRDEGLSYHYLPPAVEIALPEPQVKIVKGALVDLGFPYVAGKTWTTDAFYRETPKKVEKAKELGAICVEMECASLAAVAEFRQVPFAQLLWSADNLDAPEWDKRGLDSMGSSVSEQCMTAAIEIAKRMSTR